MWEFDSGIVKSQSTALKMRLPTICMIRPRLGKTSVVNGLGLYCGAIDGAIDEALFV